MFPSSQILSLGAPIVFYMCAQPKQYLWCFGTSPFLIWSVPTNKFVVGKISTSCAICSIGIVAPWNRPQERRRMPGLQGPNQFMSKVPILWTLQWTAINIKKTNGLRKCCFIYCNYWDAQILGKVTWAMKQFDHSEHVIFHVLETQAVKYTFESLNILGEWVGGVTHLRLSPK